MGRKMKPKRKAVTKPARGKPISKLAARAQRAKPAAAVRYARSLPVRHEVDVFVAGGGPAGVAAAVAAARQGARVFLAEGTACLGGMGTAALVPAYMQFGDGTNFLAGGIGREVLDRLHQAGGTGPDYEPGGDNRRSVAINAEALKRVYDQLLADAGVGFALHTQMADVLARRGRVEAVVCAAKSGVFAVRAAAYVDATGDGDLCAWAGAPFEKGDENGDMMPGTLCSLWSNIDWDTVRSAGLGAGGQKLEDAFRDGIFTHQDRHLPGMWRVGRDTGGGNIGHTFGVDGTDERSLTAALVWGRNLVLEYERYYKQYLKGFERMELMGTGSLLGLRETRRIMGDYVLGLEDFRRRASFDDEIGRYSYPVDIHPARPTGKDYDKFMDDWQKLRYGPGESYGIPYRSLLPRELSNVLVSGRCVSTDRYMQGSIRVMPGCYITGQACGAAAAMAARAGASPRDVDVRQLQRRLVKLGGFLPNAPRQ